jgi:deoxyribodipyrimidine photolyase-related protein
MASPSPSTLFPILDSQLFPQKFLPEASDTLFFLAEDKGAMTAYRFHKHRLVHRLASMRTYAGRLRKLGYRLRYREIDDQPANTSWLEQLELAVGEGDYSEIAHFEIEDARLERAIGRLASRHGVEHTVLPSPMFMCPRKDFATWIENRGLPRMSDFYRWRRRMHGILIDENGKPEGGSWSYDADNRSRLPASVPLIALPAVEPTPVVEEVCALVDERFADHPGSVDGFWLPTTRKGALEWLDDFLEQRISLFGPYQDALTRRSDTVFHGVLSPLLNNGLLTPAEVISKTLAFSRSQMVELNSVEGFIRQIIGWREFVRGIHKHHGDTQARRNFWNHSRGLTRAWYEGTTGIDPLDFLIRKAQRTGYGHHIERLMVAGNLMTLCEIAPKSAHHWFMEMFVDSDEWVMGPNVYGMALYSDGGLFATKPYICSSNYLRKMSDFPPGDWCDTVDGLFWRFIGRHRDFFASQPRLRMLVRSLERLDSSRRERLERSAEQFLATMTAADERAA